MRNVCLVLAIAAALAGAPLVAADGEGYFDRSLSVTGPVDLDVQTGSGRIEVHSGSSSAVVIHATIRASEHFLGLSSARERIHAIESHPPIVQSGNSIRIGHLDDPELRRGISIEYELTVPAETKLRSNTGSGSLVVDGIHGPVNAETGSGSVTISKVGDEVRARTGSGRMELESIRGNVDAHTGSGSIRASGISGRIAADTGSGGVQVEQISSGDIRAHTGSGGVTVHTPREGFELRAHTGSGSITVDRPMTVQGTISKHELMAKVGGGGSAIVDVSTGSGSIRIQ
jgi:putative adhesin